MKKMTFRELSTVLLISIVIMAVCTCTIFRPIFTTRAGDENILLSLTATAEKNERSGANEVRIESICVNGEKLHNLTRFSETSEWTTEGYLLCAYGISEPITLEIPLESVHSLEITMIGQRGSGIVEITCADSTERIDLYRDADWEAVQWSYVIEDQFAPLQRPDLLIELYVVLLGVLVFLKKFFHKERCTRLLQTLKQYFNYPPEDSYRVSVTNSPSSAKELWKTKKFWGCSALVALALMLLSFLLIPQLFMVTQPQDLELSIIATGEKSEQSGACEVRISKIYVNNSLLDFPEIAENSPGWEIDGGLLVSYDVQEPTVIHLSLDDVQSLFVSMYGQAGSGYVAFQTGDDTEKIDLYHNEGWKTFSWSYQAKQTFSVGRAFLIVGVFCILSVLFLTVCAVPEIALTCLKWLFFLAIFYINAATIFFANHAEYACKVTFLLPNQVIFFIDLCVIVCLLLLSKSKFMHQTFLSAKTISYLCIALFFVQIYLCYNYYFLTSWDVDHVFVAAKSIVEGTELSAWSKQYFSIYPNNRLLLFLMVVCLKINQFFGVLDPENGVMVFIVLNCAVSTATGWLLHRCLATLLSQKAAFWGWIAYTAYIWMSPWTAIPYSDSLGLIFPIFIYYLYLKTKNHQRVLVKWASIMFIGGIAYKVKPQSAIILIAIVLCEGLMCLKARSVTIKSAIVRSPIFILPLLLSILIPNMLVQSLEMPIDPEESFSLTHYVMMGLNPEALGFYAEEDFRYSASLATKEARTQANISVIKERLEAFGVGGYFKLLNQKLLTTYADGTFAWAVEGGPGFFKEILPEKNEGISRLLRSIYYRDGELQPYFYLYSQMFWIAILLLSIFSAFHPSKEMRMKLLPVQVSILGLTAFELLFEARARYLYTSAPLFLLLAVFGFQTLLLWGKKRSEKGLVEVQTTTETCPSPPKKAYLTANER